MIEGFMGDVPEISDDCFVHSQATILGDVSIAGACLVMAGARIIGDYGRVDILAGCTVEENCVLHAGSFDSWAAGEKGRLVLGEGVVVGHGAVIHGHFVGSRTLIGMNATILEGAVIGDGCIIAAGAVILENTNIPNGSFVAGLPAIIKGSVSGAQSRWVNRPLDEVCQDVALKAARLRCRE